MDPKDLYMHMLYVTCTCIDLHMQYGNVLVVTALSGLKDLLQVVTGSQYKNRAKIALLTCMPYVDTFPWPRIWHNTHMSVTDDLSEFSVNFCLHKWLYQMGHQVQI